jgi:RNA polymerase sigma factor (sigma-70 family)
MKGSGGMKAEQGGRGMATSGTGAVIRHLRQMVLRGDGADVTDGQLLEAFVSRRDAAAFESLVRRHGPMVLGVCRRILRDPLDVDDAFQASFLVLARKAASVSPREMVGNWLYGVAHTTAVRLRAANAKRRVRERQVADMPQPEAEQKGRQDDLHHLLDEELARLPDKYRVPIVLCDLEGRTRKEVARQLKVPEGTLSSRLTAARRMLAKRLTRRGLTISGGAVAAVSQEAASACVPASLVSATVKAATLAAAGRAAAGVIPVQVAALTEGLLKSMFLTKLKGVVVVLLVIAALGGAAGLTFQTRGAESPNPEGVGQSPASELKADGQKAQAGSPRPMPHPHTGPLPAAADFGFPIRRPDDAKGGPISLVGFVDSGTVNTGQMTPPKYKGIFLKVLLVVAEHFEQITYANQYDGRIEACTVDAKRSGIIREASVSLQVPDDGGLSITVRVNKVRTTGDKPEVVGRDTDLEQVIVAMRNARQIQEETPRKRFRGAGEELATPNAQRGHKETPPTATPTAQSRATSPASEWKKGEPQSQPQGRSALKGSWRVVSVKGGEGAYDSFRQMDLIFAGERLLAVPNGSDDSGPATVYQAHLGARRPVQEIDLSQKGGAAGTRLLGIYDVKGDELRLCLSAQRGTRPTTLEAAQKQALLVARRVKE